MKNYKVIFMGMLALVLVFGLAGCQNPAASGDFWDSQFSRGPNLLDGKTLYQGIAGTEANSVHKYVFKDGQVTRYDRTLITDAWKASWKGDYVVNAPSKQVTVNQTRTAAPSAAEQAQYAALYTLAGVPADVINQLAVRSDPDGENLVSIGVQRPLYEYIRDHSDVGLKIINAYPLTEAEFLATTDYTSWSAYINDRYLSGNSVTMFSYQIVGRSYFF
ncbi:hypothetical protein AGMMS49546_34350 [Spirochaetia bacterium]|nr:hypothetical protein AGMMS49546_34350 [Spirochaetia bacterium]